MHLPLSEISTLLAVATLLFGALWYYRETALRTPIGATLTLLIYGGFYTLVMYVAATSNAPLVDGKLMQLDAAMGNPVIRQAASLFGGRLMDAQRTQTPKG